MSGLYLLLVGILWTAVSFYFGKVVSIFFTKTWRRYVIHLALTMILLPLPLVDELVGKIRFEELCSQNSTIKVDRINSFGKTVYLANMPDTEVKDAWLRVVSTHWRFVDTRTGETLVSYVTLQAMGGRLSQLLRLSEGSVPLTFRGYCEPKEGNDPTKLLKELGIIQIQRSALEKREQK